MKPGKKVLMNRACEYCEEMVPREELSQTEGGTLLCEACMNDHHPMEAHKIDEDRRHDEMCALGVK